MSHTADDTVAVLPRKTRVLIGATGSVASIKIPIIVRTLLEELPGLVEVKVVTTDAALHFFKKEDVQAEVLTDQDEWNAWKKMSDPVMHIDLRNWADIFIVCPLDANTLAKLAQGLCDNLITCILRAWDECRPVVVCPAMNTNMWNHKFTAIHLATLTNVLNYEVIPPISKLLACGDLGQAFQAGKSYEQAIVAFVKASDAMVSATSLFMAGRALENAGNIALQKQSQPRRATDLYKRASGLYLQSMIPDRAAEMLERSAKAMEPVSVDSAIDLYIGACTIYEAEDRARYATDTFKRTISVLVKHRRFEKAIEMLQRLGNVQKVTPNKLAYYKTLLSIIIIQLAVGDEVDAANRFQAYCSIEGFAQSEESQVAHAMLDAFDQGDQEYYNQTAARQHVGFLDNEVARLARNIIISNELALDGGIVDPAKVSNPPGTHIPLPQTYHYNQQSVTLIRPFQPVLQQRHPAYHQAPESRPAVGAPPFYQNHHHCDRQRQPILAPQSNPHHQTPLIGTVALGTYGQKDVYHAYPVPFPVATTTATTTTFPYSSNDHLQQGLPLSAAALYDYSPSASTELPPYSDDERSEAQTDWHGQTTTTEKRPSSFNSPAAPVILQQQSSQSSFHGQQAKVSLGRKSYQTVADDDDDDDDDDGLL
ncbi:hypothetical protein EDD11_001010 [Mortierella claussenii]|nr:hypothetical protein EDD11_001010 [Mortierella claussenii]